MLQWGAYGFSDLLNQLENLGFFQYILPFLLIFAVVYAVLLKIHVFVNNKGAAVVVAFAIGLLALQFDIVPAFFQTVFPSFGIGLAFLLIALILAGAFLPEGNNENYKWIFFGLGMLIFLIIAVTSLSDWQFAGSWWWSQYGALIITFLVIAGAIIGIILAGKGGGNPPQK
jgi:hypothetical protein